MWSFKWKVCEKKLSFDMFDGEKFPSQIQLEFLRGRYLKRQSRFSECPLSNVTLVMSNYQVTADFFKNALGFVHKDSQTQLCVTTFITHFKGLGFIT